MEIGIIGSGLIGTSIACMAEREIAACRMTIYEPNATYKQQISARLPDAVFTTDMASLASCDFVFVCTPPSLVFDTIARLITNGGDADHGIIIDVGSLKGEIVQHVAERFPSFDRYVPGHPLAGATTAGPGDASAELLSKAPFIVTPYDAVSQDALDRATDLLERMSFRVIATDPDKHDQVVACTSHFIHVMSFLLVQRFKTIAAEAFAEDDINELTKSLGFVGGSFLSVSRYAKSDPKMWADIFYDNFTAIQAESLAWQADVADFMSWLEASSKDEIIAKLSRLQQDRRVIGDRYHED